VDAEDMVVVNGRMAAGGVFSVTGSWSVHHGSGIRVEAYGSDGTLVLAPDGRLLGAPAGAAGLAELEIPAEFGSPELAHDHVGRFRLLFEEMAGAIRGEDVEPAFATFADGLRAREIAEEIIS
jgi:predicted dehydrogenase